MKSSGGVTPDGRLEKLGHPHLGGVQRAMVDLTICSPGYGCRAGSRAGALAPERSSRTGPARPHRPGCGWRAFFSASIVRRSPSSIAALIRAASAARCRAGCTARQNGRDACLATHQNRSAGVGRSALRSRPALLPAAGSPAARRYLTPWGPCFASDAASSD